MANAKDLVLKLRSVTSGFTMDSPVRELDDLETALKDSSTEAAKSAREVKKSADDLAAPGFDRASAEAEETARRMRDAGQDAAAGVKAGADDIDRHTDKMRRDMGDTGREAGSEFVSNIAEGIGSGQANLNDIVTGTLGGLTNLAATLTGPVGIAAAGAAAGIGLVWSKMRAEAEKAAEQVQTLIGILEDTEKQGKKVQDQKIFEQWLEDAKQMPEQLDLMVEGMQTAGVKAEDFQAAIVGSEDAQKKVVEQIEKQIGKIEESRNEYGSLTTAQYDQLHGLEAVLDALETQNTNLGDAKGLHEDINWLQGESTGKQDKTTESIKKSREEAQGLKRDLDDATRDRTVNVTVNTTEKKKTSFINLDDPRHQVMYDRPYK